MGVVIIGYTFYKLFHPEDGTIWCVYTHIRKIHLKNIFVDLITIPVNIMQLKESGEIARAAQYQYPKSEYKMDMPTMQ